MNTCFGKSCSFWLTKRVFSERLLICVCFFLVLRVGRGISKGLKNEFEIAVAKEPSVFKLLYNINNNKKEAPACLNR